MSKSLKEAALHHQGLVEKTTLPNEVNLEGDNSFIQCLNKLKIKFNELCDAYKYKLIIENNEKDEKYYFLEIEKKFIGFKQVLYIEHQPYVIKEPYIVKVRATHEKQWFRFPGIKLCNIHDHGNSLDDIYIDYESEPGPNFLYDQICINQQTRKYSEDEIKYEYQKKYKDVIKYQTIDKYRDEPEYKDVLVKNFDKDMYNQDLKRASDDIINKKQVIIDLLSEINAISVIEQNLLVQINDLIKQYGENSSLESDNINKNDIDYIEDKIQFLLDSQIEIAGNTNY